MGLYKLNIKRQIVDADYNYYKTPDLHPDRIMDMHDIIYMIDGEWDIYQDDNHYLLRSGEVLILHAGRHHFSVVPCRPDTRTIFVHFSSEGDRYSDDESETSGHDAIGEDYVNLPTHIPCRGNLHVKRLFEDIVYRFKTDSPVRESVMSALLQVLMCELSDIVNMIPANDQVVQKAIKIIHDSPGEFLQTADLASRVNVSERTIRDKFVHCLGVAPHRYQMDVKLETIQSILEDYPEMKLCEIAAMFGFYDEFHLSRSFKKRYGCSPAKWRNYKKINGLSVVEK